MTSPLTPEEVGKLRLPSWFELVPISEHQGDLTFEVLCKDKWQGQFTEECRESAFGKPRTEVILAYLAENVANGHLPPSSLDAVWAIVEGKPSRETELLRNLVEWYDAAIQTRNLYTTYHHPAVTEEDHERFKIATDTTERFLKELSVAREFLQVKL
jgi:hypothetical protein